MYLIWDKTLEKVASKICGKKPLKVMKRYCVFKQTISLQSFYRMSIFYWVHSLTVWQISLFQIVLIITA